jgi:hypothetical protein
MTQGIKVFSAGGQTLLDTTTRVARLISTTNYTFPNVGSGLGEQYLYINVADIVNDGTWCAFAMGKGHSAKIFTGYVEITTNSNFRQLNGVLLIIRL